MHSRRSGLAPAAVLLGLILSGVPATSEDRAWPQKPVKIVVGYAPGGNTDVIARIVAQRLGESFGQQFIVENRPGAAGLIGAEAVAHAPPDGYTLTIGPLSQMAILPATAKASFDPLRDLVPISNIGTNPFGLVVHPSLPVRSLAAFVDYVRARNGKLSYAASGVGSLSHLSMVLFLKRAGLDMIPVTYKGGAEPVRDVIAGHVPAYFTNLPSVTAYALNGELRLLAVSSTRRVQQLADVPTFAESGFPGFNIINWNGMFAPAGMPKALVDRLAGELSRAVKDPHVAGRLTAEGIDPLGSSPEEFAATLASDLQIWAEAVKLAGLQDK